MSYLQLDGGIDDFSKAVISLWFRVPQSSIEAKIAEELPEPFPVLEATIPLMTFGVPQVSTSYQGNEQLISTYHFVPVDIFGNPVNLSVPPYGILDSPSYSPAGSVAVDPCYIGLDVHTRSDSATLSINLQTAGAASLSGIQFNPSSVDIYQTGPDAAPGNGWGQHAGSPSFTTVTDTSYAQQNQPEVFLVQSSITVTPDHWHHLLLSFDLDNACVTHGPPQTVTIAGSKYPTTADGTDSSCRLWYALDDVNYDIDNDGLFPTGVDGGDDPNAILTAMAWQVANSTTTLWANCAPAPAAYSFGPSVIPAHGAELGIPASTRYLDRVYPVEMAELQVFTGVTLDTGITANRRAFITASGTPADPLKKPNPPPPVPLPPGWVPPLKGPQELLGKEADILLHGSGNWTAGTNTGKVIELNEIGKPSSVPAANFTPTGSIVAYSPDPSLHGAQVPAPPPVPH